MRRFSLWLVLALFFWTLVSPVAAVADDAPRLAAVCPTEAEPDCQEDLEADFPKSPTADIAFDIPITVNDRVEYFIKYFQTEQKEQFSNWLSRSTRYVPRMREILRENGLPEDLVYLAMIESGFKVNAYSRARASGPWQFIEQTGRRYGLKVNYWLDERRDCEKATRAAARYLKDLYVEFGCWYLAAAGYNAGENRVRRGITACDVDEFWEMCDYGLFKTETEDYVPKMIAAAIIAKSPEKYGFADIEYQQPVSCVKVTVPPGTYLEAVALVCGTDYQTIKELNAEFRRGRTPVLGHSQVSIPSNSVELFKARFGQVRMKTQTGYHRYVTRKGDTVAKIAQRFAIARKDLLRANKITGRRSIKKGRVLRIPYLIREFALKKTGDRRKMKHHTVCSGDTIWNIARKYNVTPAEIRSWNNIKTNIIFPGTRLKVQASSPT